jgi:hypothetical protein
MKINYQKGFFNIFTVMFAAIAVLFGVTGHVAPVATSTDMVASTSKVGCDNCACNNDCGRGYAGISGGAQKGMNTDSAVSTIPAQSNVSGMSQYIDSSFGFSFWYPSNWVVQISSPQNQYISISGATLVKSVMVGPANDLSNSILIQEFTSPNFSITDNSDCGPADGCSASLTYRFDSSVHSWLKQSTQYGGSMSTIALNTFTNTMGGLHLLNGNARFGDDYIIPLSANNFLVVSSVQAGTIPEGFLAKTIVALDPSVATPVSQEEQIQTIQAEMSSYTRLGSATVSSTGQISGLNNYTDSSFGFSFFYPDDWLVNQQGNVITLKIKTGVANWSQSATITEISSSSADDSNGKWGPYAISFNTSSNQWIIARQNPNNQVSTEINSIPISIQMNTNSGLPIFNGGIQTHGWGTFDYIIPLSNQKFLIIRGPELTTPYQADADPIINLAKTITNN